MKKGLGGISTVGIVGIITFLCLLMLSQGAYALRAEIGAGYIHSLLINSVGTVWGCGDNAFGQLGDGTNYDRTAPVKVTNSTGLNYADKIEAGEYHSLALSTDGRVWAWGRNNYGQLGIGLSNSYNTPQHVSSIVNITDIDVSSRDSAALSSDGEVWAWGWNHYGQLGDGTFVNKYTPVKVITTSDEPLTDIKQLETSPFHGIALKPDGTVWTWGRNDWGELGDQTTNDRAKADIVNTIDNVIAVEAAGGFSVALKEDGTVWTWGYNGDGQLGDGTFEDSDTPVQVIDSNDNPLTNVIAIHCSAYNTLARKKDGTVWAWGANYFGSLGDGSTTHRGKAVLSGYEDMIAIDGYRHTMGIDISGTIWGSGENSQGQICDGTTTERHSPVQTDFEF